jgi:hypothetical protein
LFIRARAAPTSSDVRAMTWKSFLQPHHSDEAPRAFHAPRDLHRFVSVVSAATAAPASAVTASSTAPAPTVGTPTEVGALRARFVDGQPAA